MLSTYIQFHDLTFQITAGSSEEFDFMIDDVEIGPECNVRIEVEENSQQDGIHEESSRLPGDILYCAY